MVIASVCISIVVLVIVEYFAKDGIDLLESRKKEDVGAPWEPITDNADEVRAAVVRNAMRHAWKGYETYAWGADELRPKSKEGKTGVLGSMDGFKGLGASVIDAMSTLYIMGLHDEFEHAHAWVGENMTFVPARGTQAISFFETTIRVLGGLLSSYDLSGHRLFLDKAIDLGNRILPAFRGAPTGLLHNSASLPMTHENKNSGSVLLAECGSNLIEFGTLGMRSNNESFLRAAEDGMRFLHAKYPDKALLGTSVNRRTGEIADKKMSIGAGVDSYFEYLVKYWILRGKRDTHWRDRWVNATDSAIKELIVKPSNTNYAFVSEKVEGRNPLSSISHLGCFYPGNVALGVISGAVQGEKAYEYIDFAEKMMEACFQLYNITASGLGADHIKVDAASGKTSITGPVYLQRPEVVESLFYLYRATHNEKYRDWAWQIMEAIELFARQEAGYSGTSNANVRNPVSDNTQQSWFLAETLKYLFLIFNDDSKLDLNEWVFNTEAHPVKASTPLENEPAPWLDWSWVTSSTQYTVGSDDALLHDRMRNGVI